MKTSCTNQRNRGLTLLDIVVIIFVLGVLAAVLLPALSRAKSKSHVISCNNNQKQIGLAFRIWEGDHNNKYPMAVSSTNGGAMEAVAAGNPIPVFQVMSNELSIEEVLVCLADKYRYAATNFGMLTATNVSYFINVDAVEANPQDVMFGDDNFEIEGVPVKSGLLCLSTNAPVAWSAARHVQSGNLGMADGSVQGATTSGLQNYFINAGNATNRLAIP